MVMYVNPDDQDFPEVKPRVVCAVDGVKLAQNRAGRWIHLDELPKDTDPEHLTEPVTANAYLARHFDKEQLRRAATDMLRHHGTLHPDADCAWAANLRAALRS